MRDYWAYLAVLAVATLLIGYWFDSMTILVVSLCIACLLLGMVFA
jgi:hypothetical protein